MFGLVKKVEIDNTKPAVRPIAGVFFALDDPVTVEVTMFGGQVRTSTVPIDFATDLASIPRFLWWLYPPHASDYLAAAVWHDWALTKSDYPRWVADVVFRKLMRQCGAGIVKRRIFYIGVTLGTIRAALARLW